jgi:Retinal pigment epithelial membrane protein
MHGSNCYFNGSYRGLDAGCMLQVNPDTLEPERFFTYTELGAYSELACAHGCFDEDENAYYNLSIIVSLPWAPVSVIRVIDGVASVFATLPPVLSGYIHSFGSKNSSLCLSCHVKLCNVVLTSVCFFVAFSDQELFRRCDGRSKNRWHEDAARA